MKKIGRRIGLIPQVAIMFAIGVLLTGLITFYSQRDNAEDKVKEDMGAFARYVTKEVDLCVREYPAHDWLLNYWYEHAGDLDLEYDVEYDDENTETEAKCRYFSGKYPELQLKYLTAEEVEALPEEDQKIYAEITYSWLITRVNQIKRTHNIDFIFCVLTEPPFDKQFFLFSAADLNAVRGTNYEEVYPLGVVVDVGESQQEEMRRAATSGTIMIGGGDSPGGQGMLVDAGKYVDYYTFLSMVSGKAALIGITFDLSALQQDIHDDTVLGVTMAMLYQIILSFVCLIMIYFFVLQPLQAVQKNIRLYKTTKDSEKILGSLSEIRPHNEIGELSEDVAELANEMDDYMERMASITAEKERIGTELSLATRIQMDSLPSDFPAFPERPEFDVYASMDPAKEVGGDFYDFFLIDDDHLCLLMADVSGKGIPAALFMMASKIILANNAMMGKSPARILTDTNNSICKHNQEEMFVTVWLGILTISTGKLVCANAGHEYPVIKGPDGGFEVLKDKHGFVIGGMEDISYKEYEVALKPGSKFFIYTDGVPEATNSGSELYGTDRMIDALNRDADAEPAAILKNVKNDVDAFVGDAEQFDDLTMLILDYRGSGKKFDDLTVDASVENLEQVLGFVDSHLEAAGCPAKTSVQIDLAVEEIFVNIAHYAYAPSKGTATISIAASEAAGEAVISFTDSGKEYNPLAKEDPDIHLSSDARPIGGLGVYLVKETMDSVSYSREDGSNILTIKKKF